MQRLLCRHRPAVGLLTPGGEDSNLVQQRLVVRVTAGHDGHLRRRCIQHVAPRRMLRHSADTAVFAFQQQAAGKEEVHDVEQPCREG